MVPLCESLLGDSQHSTLPEEASVWGIPGQGSPLLLEQQAGLQGTGLGQPIEPRSPVVGTQLDPAPVFTAGVALSWVCF